LVSLLCILRHHHRPFPRDNLRPFLHLNRLLHHLRSRLFIRPPNLPQFLRCSPLLGLRVSPPISPRPSRRHFRFLVPLANPPESLVGSPMQCLPIGLLRSPRLVHLANQSLILPSGQRLFLPRCRRSYRRLNLASSPHPIPPRSPHRLLLKSPPPFLPCIPRPNLL
jgi:hypothetical protein